MALYLSSPLKMALYIPYKDVSIYPLQRWHHIKSSSGVQMEPIWRHPNKHLDSLPMV